MTSRARLVFLAVAAIAAVPGLLATDGVVLNDARSSSTGLPLGLVDVGDAWRALLLGAPPILL